MSVHLGRSLKSRIVKTVLLIHRQYVHFNYIPKKTHANLLVNNQLNAQFFMYVYFYSLHVSGSHVSTVTLCRWPSGIYQTVIYTEWNRPGVASIQKFSWWWTHCCPKHVQNRNKHTWIIVRQVGYLQESYHDARLTQHKTRQPVITISFLASDARFWRRYKDYGFL